MGKIMHQRQQNTLSVWEMLSLAGQIGYIVAIPAFVFGFGGALLDKRLETVPWLMIAGFGLAFTVSAITLARLVRRMLSR